MVQIAATNVHLMSEVTSCSSSRQATVQRIWGMERRLRALHADLLQHAQSHCYGPFRTARRRHQTTRKKPYVPTKPLVSLQSASWSDLVGSGRSPLPFQATDARP